MKQQGQMLKGPHSLKMGLMASVQSVRLFGHYDLLSGWLHSGPYISVVLCLSLCGIILLPRASQVDRNYLPAPRGEPSAQSS